jgi:NAD+ kinase
MAEVLLVAFETRPDATSLADEVSSRLRSQGVSARPLILAGDNAGRMDAIEADLVVSLGGDGTFLRAARLAHESNSDILGVNLGRVGFLLPVDPSRIDEEIRIALSGEAHIESRLALRVTSPDFDLDSFALNEVVLERTQAGHMVRVRTYIDDDEFLTYSADGVLVCTPTGSTAYNFSAGGPVVSSELEVMVLTPIAPHFTIDRSVVVNQRQIISLQATDSPAVIVTDGVLAGRLEAGQRIVVENDPRSVRVVNARQLGLGARLRGSLREGHA